MVEIRVAVIAGSSGVVRRGSIVERGGGHVLLDVVEGVRIGHGAHEYLLWVSVCSGGIYWMGEMGLALGDVRPIRAPIGSSAAYEMHRRNEFNI